jgi:O-antigen ligase
VLEPLIGVAAGAGAAGLLAALPTMVAALAPAALLAGVMVLVAPQLGLYLLTGAMIAQWPYRLLTVAGAAVTVATLFWALAARRTLVPRDGVFLLVALLVGLVLLSALANGEPEGFRVALSFVSFVALYWTVVTLCETPAAVIRLADVMLLAGLAIALIGMVQFVYPFVWIASAQMVEAASSVNVGMELGLLQWEGFRRIESLTGTPNYLGLTMQILLPFAVLWTWRQREPLRVVAGVAVTGALAAALVLSFTRGAMLTTAAITVPLLALRIGLRRSMPFLFLGALLVAAVVGLWEPLRARVASTLVEVLSSDPGTAAGWRVAVLPIGFQMFLDHFWTGVGIGQQRSLWQQYAPTYIFAPGAEQQLPIHNGYLAIAIDLGVAGLLLLLLLLGTVWLRLRRLQTAFRAGGAGRLFDLACAAEIAWVSMIANIMMYPGLENFRYFWVLLALIGGLSRLARAPATPRRGPVRAAGRNP